MAGGSNGYRAAPVRRQLTPGLISSLPRAAGLPPLSLFRQATVSWTLPCDVLCLGLANAEEYFAVAQAALLEAKHRKSIAIQEKSGYLLRQRGNERFVGNPYLIVT